VELSVQTTEEKEVRRALDEYKIALNTVAFRNWWHRINLFLGELPAIQAEKKLKAIEERVRRSVNQSEERRRLVRLISNQRPASVRERIHFLRLIIE
jgi:hypothetical protein